MADSVSITFRGIALEDFLTSNTTAQVEQTVMGVGQVLVTPIVAAASDTDAAAAGVPVSGVYLYTGATPNYLKSRQS